MSDLVEAAEELRQRNIVHGKKGWMCIYLAGKMTGVPHFNYPAFFAVAERLRSLGHVVFNPAEHDVVMYGPRIHEIAMANTTGYLTEAEKAELKFDRRKVAAADMAWICENAEALAVLPGWRKGRLSRAEHALAVGLDLTVIKIPRSWLKDLTVPPVSFIV